MKLITKIAFSAALLVTATAATFPRGIGEVLGTYPSSVQEREALKLCQAHNPSFIRFIASERRECFRQMWSVVGMPASYGAESRPAGEPKQAARD